MKNLLFFLVLVGFVLALEQPCKIVCEQTECNTICIPACHLNCSITCENEGYTCAKPQGTCTCIDPETPDECPVCQAQVEAPDCPPEAGVCVTHCTVEGFMECIWPKTCPQPYCTWNCDSLCNGEDDNSSSRTLQLFTLLLLIMGNM